jgi:hypothetical protein
VICVRKFVANDAEKLNFGVGLLQNGGGVSSLVFLVCGNFVLFC